MSDRDIFYRHSFAKLRLLSETRDCQRQTTRVQERSFVFQEWIDELDP